MKPVRINIQNKELGEKERKLYKRWESIARVAMVITIIWLIGTVLIPMFNTPKWLGYVWIGFAVIAATLGFLTIIFANVRNRECKQFLNVIAVSQHSSPLIICAFAFVFLFLFSYQLNSDLVSLIFEMNSDQFDILMNDLFLQRLFQIIEV